MGFMDKLNDLAKKAQDKIQEVAAKVTAPEVAAAPEPVQDWYYTIDGKTKHGPFPLNQLKKLAEAGQLQPSHMVKQEGTNKWVVAGQVEALRTSLAPSTREQVPVAGPASQTSPPPLPTNPDDKWYYAANGQQAGPVSVLQLKELSRAGQLTPTDMVWKEGMAAWAAASSQPNLFPKPASAPPPVPDVAGTVPPPLPVQLPESANAGHDAGVQSIELRKTGRQKVARGEYALAIDIFSKAIRLDPTNADAYFERGSAYFAKGYLKRDFADAIPDLMEALRLNPAHKEAQEHLAEAKKYAPQSPSPPNAVVAVQIVPTSDASAASSQPPLPGQPPQALTHLNTAARLSKDGKFQQAIAEYTAALRLDSHLWKAFLGRGEAHHSVDDHHKAIADLSEAIRLNPECADAYRERAYVYYVENKLEQSIADATNALRLNPNDAGAFRFKGCSHLNLKQFDEAIRDLSKSLALDPKDAGTFQSRGLAYWLTDDNANAIADFSRSLALNQKNDFTAYCRGRAYFDANRFQEAIPDLERGLHLPPQAEDAKERLAKARHSVPSPQTNTQSTSQGTPVTPTAQRHYLDCPNCGKSYFVDQVDPSQRIDCSDCNKWFLVEDALNLRTTAERVETKGFFQRLWSGSSIQKSNREKLEARARTLQAIIRNEELKGNYQAAQLWQLRLNDIMRQLGEL